MAEGERRLLVQPLVRLLGSRVAYVATIPESVPDAGLDEVYQAFLDSWPPANWSDWLSCDYELFTEGRCLRIELETVQLSEASVLTSLSDADVDYLEPLTGRRLEEQLVADLTWQLDYLDRRISDPPASWGRCPFCEFMASESGTCALHQSCAANPDFRQLKTEKELSVASGQRRRLLEFCAAPLPESFEESYEGSEWGASVEFRLEVDPELANPQ